MSDVKFACPHCSHSLEAPDSLLRTETFKALIAKAPEPVRILLKIVLFPFLLLFAMPNILIGIVVMLGVLIIGGVLIFSFPFVALPAILVGSGLWWAYDVFQRKRLAGIAARVLREPKRPFAVKTLKICCPAVPRIWMRGDRIAG